MVGMLIEQAYHTDYYYYSKLVLPKPSIIA